MTLTASCENFILGKEPVDFNSPTDIQRFYSYVAQLFSLTGEAVEPMVVNESVPDLMILQALEHLMKIWIIITKLENPVRADLARIYGLLMMGFVADMEKSNPDRAQAVFKRFIKAISKEARQQQGASGGVKNKGIKRSPVREVLEAAIADIKKITPDEFPTFKEVVKHFRIGEFRDRYLKFLNIDPDTFGIASIRKGGKTEQVLNIKKIGKVSPKSYPFKTVQACYREIEKCQRERKGEA